MGVVIIVTNTKLLARQDNQRTYPRPPQYTRCHFGTDSTILLSAAKTANVVAMIAECPEKKKNSIYNNNNNNALIFFFETSH